MDYGKKVISVVDLNLNLLPMICHKSVCENIV